MLKKGKSLGVDNIPGELVQAGGEGMISVLHKICNKIWESGIWPREWTQSLVITLPKKGNLQQCQNYMTIRLICHPSKVLLRTTNVANFDPFSVIFNEGYLAIYYPFCTHLCVCVCNKFLGL